MRDCVEMVQKNKSNQCIFFTLIFQVQLMKPLAKRLEKISEQIMGTGENILNRLQFVPRRLSNSSIPGIIFKINSFYIFLLSGFLSTFSVCHEKSFAVIDKPIYEKVLCTVPLCLADENGILLDVFHDIDINAEMKVFDGKSMIDKDKRSAVSVDISVESTPSEGWRLKFYSPHSGIAQLSVKIDNKHIR